MAGQISETFCKRVQPPKTGHAIYWDGAIDGLGLRVTARGQKSFVLQYRIWGKQHRFTIGHYATEYTADMARARALELKQGIREGRDPFTERERQAQAATEEEARGRTVRELATAFMREHVKPYRRPKTAREYQAIIDNHILPKLGRFRVGAVLPRDVSQVHASLRGTPYLANRTVALVSAMYGWAKKHDAAGWGISSNPAEGVERFHEESRVRQLSDEELGRLAGALDKYPDRCVHGLVCSRKQRQYLHAQAERIAKAITLIMLTGSRRSEVLGAHWTEFDLNAGRWTKPARRMKAGRTEIIPLSDAAVALLRSLPRNGEYIFPGHTAGQPLTEIKGPWRDICRTAGITGLRVHDLRHAFASWLVSGGETLPTIGALLGHSQPSVTAKYSHLQDQRLRDAANRFGLMVGTNGKRGSMAAVAQPAVAKPAATATASVCPAQIAGKTGGRQSLKRRST